MTDNKPPAVRRHTIYTGNVRGFVSYLHEDDVRAVLDHVERQIYAPGYYTLGAPGALELVRQLLGLDESPHSEEHGDE